METQNTEETTNEKMTTQARERALLQVIKNWHKLKNEELIDEEEHLQASKIMQDMLDIHIQQKYGSLILILFMLHSALVWRIILGLLLLTAGMFLPLLGSGLISQ